MKKSARRKASSKFLFLLLAIVAALAVTVYLFIALSPARKPLASSTSCSISATTVKLGDTIKVTHSGFASGASVRLQGNLTSYVLGTTQDSLSGSVDQTVMIPVNTITGQRPYDIIIIPWFPVPPLTCSGGPISVVSVINSCDFNKDSNVNVLDVQIVAQYVNTKNLTYDVNKNGSVNVIDLQIVANNNPTYCKVT